MTPGETQGTAGETQGDRLALLSPAKRAVLERALLERALARGRGSGAAGSRIPRRTGDGPAPLTHAQRGMWFLEQWQPGGGLYTAREALRLTGPLDVAAFRRALEAVVRRHSILRTVFAEVDERPVVDERLVQVVTPPGPVSLPLVDLRALQPEERRAAVRDLRQAEGRCHFDLARGPMLRAVLLRTGDAEHVLLLSVHHIVADGWSHSLLVRELSAHYAAFVRGEAPRVADVPLQFADYAEWQVRGLDGDELRAGLTWWRSRLADAPPLLGLPTDHPRTAGRVRGGGITETTIAPGVAGRLRALSAASGATMFMTLLASFQALLHRWSGDTDVVVGCPVAGRSHADVENLIGCFVNAVALRTDLGGDPSFAGLLDRVREVTLSAYVHQDVPFEWLVEELRLPRGAGHSPVFQVMFAFQNTPPATWDLPGVTVAPAGLLHPPETFDLSLTMRDGEEGLVATLSYSADLFEAGTAERVLGAFAALLARAADAPHLPISELAGRALAGSELAGRALAGSEPPGSPMPGPRRANGAARPGDDAGARAEEATGSGPSTPGLSTPGPSASSPPASGQVADLVRAIWAEVLGTEVTPETDFFTAGGHSLLAVRVMTRIRRLLGVDLPVRVLFEAPLPGRFAHRVEEAMREGSGAAVPAVPAVRPQGRDRPIPLSHAQRRLWFIDQLDRDGAHHNVATVLRLDGPLDPAALAHAADVVRERHESPRTTFRQVGGALRQVVSAHVPSGLPLADLSGLGEAEAEREGRRLAEAEAARPFDLARGPLLRMRLVRLSPARHLLSVTLHHIVTDAWSSEVLFGELWAAYAARLRGEPTGLPPLPVQYADYALWEERHLDEVTRRSAAYWTERLAGAPETLDLPYDHPLPATPVFRSASLPYALTPERTRALVAFGLREGATVFMTVLAAYLIVLHRHTRQTDLVVGSGTANRAAVEVEPLIGFFTNQLVLRTGVSGADTVRDVLSRVRETTLGAHTHAELPFDRLVELVRPPRRANRPPLFHVEIEYHRRPDRVPGPPGVEVAPLELHAPTATQDLSLHVVQTETVVRGDLIYNADAFAPATARRMLGEFLGLLDAIAASAETGTDSQPDASAGSFAESRVDEVAARVENEWRAAAARERAALARARFEGLRGRPRDPDRS
ncbi:condensation domain-containing protein [Microbispora sp. NBC_01189]|uniref:condensation domain-containing protein n=1 Tax=Microbispora sp. NBC_01189 TaxID=2903583 RepID=UPI002E14741E|nr:condensation domain-containing protein [Microbispora sp. NBC_01189]